MDVLFAFSVALAFAGVCYRLKWLTLGGAASSGSFGFCLLWLGNVSWIVPVLVFFITSSILSKPGRASDLSRKDDVRNATQVLANGGVAWLLLLGNALEPSQAWYAGFAGSMAAATADTWATEIGRICGGEPRSILNGQRVPKGTSGGITAMGTLGSIAGTALIGSIAAWYAGLSCGLIVGFAGLAGSLVDSMLGASVQARFRDVATGEITERPGGPAIRGWPWMTNDAVNAVCTLVGGMLGAVLYLAA